MRIVPAKNGAAWLARGFALFRRNPPFWLLLMFTYLMADILLVQIPYVGQALSVVLLPPVTMCFLAFCVQLEGSHPVRPGALVDAFRVRFRDLAMLGLLYFACLMLALGLASLADASLLQLVIGGPDSPEEMGDYAALRARVLVTAATLPVVLAFWFATPLVGWGGMGPLQALFYSFFAALRNWRAFVVYIAVVVGIAMAVLVVLGMAATITHQREIAWSVALLAMIVLMPVGVASTYASYRDVFPEGGTAPVLVG